MEDRTFSRVMLIVLGLCAALTLAHAFYGIYAYQHSSIIEWIARELW